MLTPLRALSERRRGAIETALLQHERLPLPFDAPPGARRRGATQTRNSPAIYIYIYIWMPYIYVICCVYMYIKYIHA